MIRILQTVYQRDSTFSSFHRSPLCSHFLSIYISLKLDLYKTHFLQHYPWPQDTAAAVKSPATAAKNENGRGIIKKSSDTALYNVRFI